MNVNIPQLGHPERVVSFLGRAHILYQSVNSSVSRTRHTHIRRCEMGAINENFDNCFYFKPASKTTFCKYISSSNDFNCQSNPDCLHRPERPLMKLFQHWFKDDIDISPTLTAVLGNQSVRKWQNVSLGSILMLTMHNVYFAQYIFPRNLTSSDSDLS